MNAGYITVNSQCSGTDARLNLGNVACYRGHSFKPAVVKVSGILLELAGGMDIAGLSPGEGAKIGAQGPGVGSDNAVGAAVLPQHQKQKRC